jgi:hypothetical protein
MAGLPAGKSPREEAEAGWAWRGEHRFWCCEVKAKARGEAVAAAAADEVDPALLPTTNTPRREDNGGMQREARCKATDACELLTLRVLISEAVFKPLVHMTMQCSNQVWDLERFF